MPHHPPHQPLPLLAAVMPAGIRLHAVVRPAVRPDAGPADYTESSHLHPHHPRDLEMKNKRKWSVLFCGLLKRPRFFSRF